MTDFKEQINELSKSVETQVITPKLKKAAQMESLFKDLSVLGSLFSKDNVGGYLVFAFGILVQMNLPVEWLVILVNVLLIVDLVVLNHIRHDRDKIAHELEQRRLLDERIY